jgi:hypothetical protein
MMRTSFALGDNSPMPTRQATRQTYTAEPRPNLRDQMVSTHFDLKNPAELKVPWQTTHDYDFQDPKSGPPPPVSMALNRGFGAKATFENMGAYQTRASLMHDSYRPAEGEKPRPPIVTVTGTDLNFAQGPNQEWRRTNFKVGDDVKRFTTTTGDGLRPPGYTERPDPTVARDRKLALSKSSAGQGHHFPTVTDTTTRDALQPHPDVRPPPLAERTAFVSHHDYRNYRGSFSTTHRDAFAPKEAEPVFRLTGNLQESHAKFGLEGEPMGTTLYRDTFTKPKHSAEPVDVAAARNFHQGHHNDHRIGPSEQLESTTYRSEFTGCKGGKASDSCDFLRGGHNVVANDPCFNVKRSAMKEEFIPHKGVERPAPVDNFLQRSHIQLAGGGQQWTTTQQDYFLWEQYKMPGHPF